MRKKERFENIIHWFKENRPIAETELHHNDPYQLMVAVILSAQCTDKRVNLITPAFFSNFPTIYDLANASVESVLEVVRSCSYPNNKSKHLVKAAQTIRDKFGGIVPEEIDELQTIPGVGRKTANVIASVAYDRPAMAVDTHVHRVSARTGLTTNAKNPLETEKQLVKHIPESLLSIAHHWLILHGRYVCKARKPDCEGCGISDFCKYFEKNSKSD